MTNTEKKYSNNINKFLYWYGEILFIESIFKRGGVFYYKTCNIIGHISGVNFMCFRINNRFSPDFYILSEEQSRILKLELL